MLHQQFRPALFAVLASCAIALSGCGGGSLKKKALELVEEAGQEVLDAVEEELTPDPGEKEGIQFFARLLGQVNEQSDRLDNVQEKIALAAQSAPNRGNATQSSAATDSISVMAGRNDAGEITYGVENTNSAPGKGWTIKSHGEGRDTTLSRTMVEGRHGIELYKVIDRDRIHPGTADEKNPDGRLWVGVVTDIESPGDTDYLAGGIWAYLPNDADEAADYEFGAFVDGPQPFAQGNLAALEGAATYEGDATGVYSVTAENTNYFFAATATLTADFGDAGERGSISGTIHDATAHGRAGDFSSVVLHLNSADMTDTEGGFFTGGTTVLGGDFNDPAAFTGTWGGRFFGNPAADAENRNPGSVAGTFGASLNDPDGDPRASILGFFGAPYQPPASR